jgi:RNA polymerase sigma factor (sigma-70 family)
MQELFIKLSCSRGFENAANPYAYAWKAAVNLAFQWRRMKKPIQSLESLGVADQYAAQTESTVIQEEELQRVLDITTSFKELARQVIVMRFIEQHSYEEMADRLGKKPDYLRALCSKSLTRLRTILNQTSEEHPDREVCNE